MPARRTKGMKLILDREAMTADHYTGAIYLTMQYADQPLTVPIDLSIRKASFWATIVLFIGVVAGQFSRIFSERKGAAREGGFGDVLTKCFKGELRPSEGLKKVLGLLKGEAGPLWVIGKLVLIVIAVYLGLDLFYSGERGATFGSVPSDYVALLLWGYGADTSSRGLFKVFKRT